MPQLSGEISPDLFLADSMLTSLKAMMSSFTSILDFMSRLLSETPN